MPHYLIVWGSAAESIREGSGPTERDAAHNAFGSYDVKRMTFKKLSLQELRSTRKRTKLCFDLLASHIDKSRSEKFLDENEPVKIVSNAMKVREDLEKRYKKDWEKSK